ncbi:Six-hairpin glycosidase-like protein [Lobosporangium transversale]|uniref:alpha,alpha-trehalase n=1 Tax=Lobosporangium transversale TaxID=64571 RepID=A0A1Y2GAI1_9FUNG|nr:Six-hairpin glycosidase-like protein [Lobosporangium transversale]ORZ05353.1 Six-hairpin glycosidase-like protein [Lobosporangium transversale]|eukprot:XP_021877045.1 Six-hairpin glycosidase-like protein [Lobosporangium transversale]
MPTRSSLFGGLGLLLSTALPLIIASPIPLHGSYVSLDGWTLSTTVINTTSFLNEPYVSNGYIGARLPVEGVGLRIHPAIDYEGRDGVQGWPLFELRQTASIVAGFYNQQGDTKGTNFQTGGQQVISLLPTWTSLFLTVSPSPDSPPEDWVTYRPGVELSQVKSFRQSLSLRNGVVQTNVTWSPFDPSNNGSHIQLHYTVVAHRSRPNLGLVRLDISGLTKGQQVIITDALDGAGAQRVQGEQAGSLKQNELPNAIYSSVQPFGVSDVTAWEISALEFIGLKDENYTAIGIPASVGLKDNFTSTASQSYSVSAPANGHLTVIKAVGIASTDAFNGTERSTALAAVKKAQADGWDELLEEHDEAWETIWDEGGEIATILDELQLTTISSLYHLLANIRDGNEGRGLGDNSIAPAGLTSDSYAGGIFWDADLWMYPSLLSLFPDYAMSINNYRSKNLDQAYKNAQQYNRSGLLYPWVAFRYGNCTGIGPCYDYEYHLNNDIALAQWQYFQTTNNKTWLEEWGYPIMKGVSEFWASHVIWNPDTNRYITLNETDPDEYANHVDNAAFTNAGLAVNFENSIQAASILGKSHEVPKNWSDIAEKITILYEPTSDVILEYDGFNATTPVKQADVVLLIYPLESDKVRDPHEDLAFYLGANSPNGPGMTYSVFSIGSAQLAYQGCEAYTYLLQSSEPYVRGPFSQFSEQATDEYSKNAGTNPAYTFLTGNGGFLQTWTHGFTGYRPHLDCFYLDPSLPPQLAPDGFTVRGMKWQGSVFDVTVQGSRTIIRRRSGKRSSKACVEIGKRNKNRGKHQLSVGETLTVGTYRSDLNGTLIPGNKAQCALKVTSKDPILPGQYALAAVDGSNATYWRPDTKSPASMTIDLGKVQTINGFHLNFNRIPPKSYSVNDNKHNNGSIGMKQVARVDQVEITAPYDEKTAGVVIVRLGNTSDVSLAESVKARFVRLVVEGVLTDDGTTAGATVAEIAVL